MGSLENPVFDYLNKINISRANLTPNGWGVQNSKNVLHGFAIKTARLHALNYRANRMQSNLFELLRCRR